MLRVANLPGEKAANDFHRKASTINKIAIEDVGVLLGGNAINLKYIEEIIILAMDISAHCDFFVVLTMDVHH